MLDYFKAKWDEMQGNKVNWDVAKGIEEDVLEDAHGTAKIMTDDMVEGLVDKNEVVMLIKEERLDVSPVLESHLKAKKLHKITNGHSWVVKGDINVTLKCINDIEVTDLCSSGMFFTWSKNPKSVIPGVMKTLDRIMVNEELLSKFNNTHVVFLPYLTFDHSSGMIVFPNKEVRRKKSFKFMNYISDKPEFIQVVTNGWNKEVTNEEIKEAMFSIGDNRAPGLDGFTSNVFKKDWNIIGVRCAKGLRQGDPISPYLFTLVMEVFTLMMKRKVKEHPKFKFHKGCKGIRLTHLCFANDLLVLCNGDVHFVNVLKEALDEFSKA
ncbi:RNA-directed DNA polymerase, eukaryota, reverse transcriptase zinc-binding domain protein [Tanacetum coccineum]|uniref:RNA-directed DNA polymerase, eukaryota, reverse transcriptase zinc-binding domain protein n=1 Tax=Tanacetum coccineum TaxID=301880 RepID=A0ABQ5FHX6_9ASTR